MSVFPWLGRRPHRARGSAPFLLGLLLAAGPAWAAIATDAIVSRDGSTPATSITTPAFSTTAGNELLLAFVSTDGNAAGVTVTGVTGAGLTWALVQRTNVQLGTAEIWRSLAGAPLSNVTVRANLSQSVAASMTVVSFTGVVTTGTNGSGAIGATGSANAPAGAPSATLVTTGNDSWVWGVGTDWDNPIARAVGPDQTMVHQFMPPVGDTYWVQRRNGATAASGTSVTINDTAPTGDRYNLSIVEVLAAQVGPTYALSGTIHPTAAGSGTTLSLSGAQSATVTANADGSYSFTGLSNGNYTVVPSKSGATFSPVSQAVTINDGPVTNVDFTATVPPAPLNYPDLSEIIPASGISIVGSGSSREFQHTHLTFNGGSGPLIIQPSYSLTSGNYFGTQYVYSFDAGTWTRVVDTPIAGVFVFHPAHGHFHYPFAAYGLHAVAADGGIGPPVVLSSKIGFCIANSYIYDPTLPNAGALGILGSCSDPLSLRGLDIGAVDEYDRRDDGQSISLDGVPDGTYWLRAIVDPDNFLAESDENNNETDVRLTITGNTVEVLETVTPVLPPLPAIALDSPVDGATVSGTVALIASTPVALGVQFLLDGLPLGGIVTPDLFSLAWNSTTVPNGVHWLAVQTTDANGRTNTSSVARVTVANGSSQDTDPPVVTITEPEAGEIVSASFTMGATVADQSPITGLQFYVDGAPMGAPLAAPPYLASWNTRVFPDGPHVVTASATDAGGLVGLSPPVTVTVDNSNPPAVIGKDVVVSVDGSGVLATPPFTTPTADDFMVAFVSYDGPAVSPQTATVTGAGLDWVLVKRSNVQHGTSEIWAARASGVLSNAVVVAQPEVANYHGSLTVIGFTNSSGAGVAGQASAPTGPPDIFLPGVAAGSWVFAAGNDWDRAIPRTPVAGQELVHQWVDTGVGDTFWVQSTTAPSASFGLVTIHDTAPTTDQWNYVAVEIVATTSTVGTSPGGAAPGTMSLSAAFPNPTYGGVSLHLALPRAGEVSLAVFDIQGREVWSAPSHAYGAGRWVLSWDGRTARGTPEPGVYLARVRVGTQSMIRRFAILR